MLSISHYSFLTLHSPHNVVLFPDILCEMSPHLTAQNLQAKVPKNQRTPKRLEIISVEWFLAIKFEVFFLSTINVNVDKCKEDERYLIFFFIFFRLKNEKLPEEFEFLLSLWCVENQKQMNQQPLGRFKNRTETKCNGFTASMLGATTVVNGFFLVIGYTR